MASRMDSGGSNELNCIKTDPRTGEKFIFNVVGATAWQHPQQCTFIHARELYHVSSNGGVFVIVLYIMSLSTNEIGRYLNYIQKRKLARRGVIAWSHSRRLSGSLYGFLDDVIHSRYIAWLRGFTKSLRPFRASLTITRCISRFVSVIRKRTS